MQNRGIIRADGKRLLDGSGRTFQIRGVNLGNWLVPECYMALADVGNFETGRYTIERGLRAMHIRWRVELTGDGIHRNEIPEIPVDALREAIVIFIPICEMKPSHIPRIFSKALKHLVRASNGSVYCLIMPCVAAHCASFMNADGDTPVSLRKTRQK